MERNLVRLCVFLWCLLAVSASNGHHNGKGKGKNNDKVKDTKNNNKNSDVMPPPFTRVLEITEPNVSGNDVTIAQHLLSRSQFVQSLNISGVYDQPTSDAVLAFQSGNNCLTACQEGIFDQATAELLLDKHSCDGYQDDGASARSLGYKYKIFVPVFKNRSIETDAILYDADNTELLVFRVRAHGHDDMTTKPWPDFNNSIGLNMFTSNGNTPTGLMRFDLNSPEGNDKLYGPYPVNRAVDGLKGNAAFMLPHIRSGILLHTGDWEAYGWVPPANMPNSAGCLHAWPSNIKAVWQALVDIGVQVRDNPGGVYPYPFEPQGLLSVMQVDGC